VGFRFRKSVRVMPGVRLNLSKSGISASVGRKGATVNIGPRGTKTTVGLPGTGLSYSTAKQFAARPGGGRNGAGQGGGQVNGCVALFGLGGFVALLAAVGLHAPATPPSDTPSPAVAVAASTPAIVTAHSLTCREAANRGGSKIASYSHGARVIVASRVGDWAEVDRGDVKCWVLSSYLSDEDAAATPGVQGLTSAAAAVPTRSHAAHRLSRKHHHSSGYGGGECPCSGGNVCIGPRGGRYCITSGGNKRYGV